MSTTSTDQQPELIREPEMLESIRFFGYADQEVRIIKELKPLGVWVWHATHGFSQRFRCAYCNKDYLASYDAFRSAEFDHIVPRSNGGEHTDENIVVCCRTCNLIKQAYLPSGNSRAERIADARRYVQGQRLLREAEVEKLRHLVRGDTGNKL